MWHEENANKWICFSNGNKLYMECNKIETEKRKAKI